MQSYKLELSDHARRILGQMAHRESELYRRVAKALDGLEQDPSQGKSLKGELKGLYSYRVGSYRIIYRIHHHKLLVVVIDIGHRREIYRS